jgi:hypothetical protein
VEGIAPQKARLLAPAILAGLTEVAVLAAWQRNGYWDYSGGVYAVSARELLHGLAPYRDFAAAQPPGVYLAGALLLAVRDGVGSLHVGLGLVDLVTAALVAWCVWRLDGSARLALVAGAAAPLVPISLHEHAQLTPETVAAPLILGGAVWCARRSRTEAGAALLALAAGCKLAFAVPAVAVTVASAAPRRAVATLVVAGAALAALSLSVFGVDVWRETVHAQLQVGRTPLHDAIGLLAQGAWNEAPLVLGAAAFAYQAWSDPGRLRDPALARTLGAACVAGLVLVFTVFKRGSYVNVLVVAEPPLLALAACGAAWSWRRWRTWRLVVGAAVALLAAQSASLLIHPSDPWVAKRPFATSGLNWSASPAAVTRAVGDARRCPRTEAYSGDPYFAFLAGRRMPGDQPDPFMLQHAAVNAGFARRAARDEPRCP